MSVSASPKTLAAAGVVAIATVLPACAGPTVDSDAFQACLRRLTVSVAEREPKTPPAEDAAIDGQAYLVARRAGDPYSIQLYIYDRVEDARRAKPQVRRLRLVSGRRGTTDRYRNVVVDYVADGPGVHGPIPSATDRRWVGRCLAVSEGP